jgi:hypothetical protein
MLNVDVQLFTFLQYIRDISNSYFGLDVRDDADRFFVIFPRPSSQLSEYYRRVSHSLIHITLQVM